MTSTTWAQMKVGDRVMWDGGECEGEHEVRVLKVKGSRARVVLQSLGCENAAKFAIAVRLSDEVSLPEGAEVPPDAAKLVEDVLGGVPVATVVGKDVICPPMDVTLIAAHLRIMHGVELEGLDFKTEDDMLRVHSELHEAPFHEPAHAHRHEEAA